MIFKHSYSACVVPKVGDHGRYLEGLCYDVLGGGCCLMCEENLNSGTD